MKTSTNKRRNSTVLAALRFWQRTALGKTPPEMDIATDGGTVKPYTAKEIDSLCEEFNLGTIEMTTVRQSSDRHKKQAFRIEVEDGIVAGVRLVKKGGSSSQLPTFAVREYDSDGLDKDHRTGKDRSGREYYEYPIDILNDDA